VLNGETLGRIDEQLQRELAGRLRREFWYRPLAHTPLYYRVADGNQVVFAGPIELLRSEPPHWQADPTGLQLLTYWRATKPPEPDQALFVHMLGAQGERVAQIDLPLQGAYAWQPGEVMPLELLLPLPVPPPDGDYRLVLGLYSFSSGQRLAIKSGGDMVELARVVCRAGRCEAQVGADP
jgi:hypothetical protein